MPEHTPEFIRELQRKVDIISRRAQDQYWIEKHESKEYLLDRPLWI